MINCILCIIPIILVYAVYKVTKKATLAYLTRDLEEDEEDRDLNQLAKEIGIWERWSYSFSHREITCFTEKVIDFDDKKKEWVITYKPKAWFVNIGLREIHELRKIPELHRTFRLFKDGWFTEREKGEPCEEIEGVDEFFDNH